MSCCASNANNRHYQAPALLLSTFSVAVRKEGALCVFLRESAWGLSSQESRPLAFNLLVAQYSCTGITQACQDKPI